MVRYLSNCARNIKYSSSDHNLDNQESLDLSATQKTVLGQENYATNKSEHEEFKMK